VGSLEDETPFQESWSKRELLERLTFPTYWPPGLPKITLRWVAEVYDPRTMPTLQLASTPEGNISLLGWKSEDGEGPGLIEAVRGFGLTEKEQAVARLWPNVVWCPRCWKDAFVSYDATDKQPAYDEGFTPPALSRMDNETYICSACGQDEAMRDYMKQPPIPPDDWPVSGPGFGLGIASTGNWPGFGVEPGPYGTNEGDIWGAEGSDIQDRLPEGQVLIHEVIDGEEKVYVTTDPELIERAAAGTIKYLAQKAEEN
jgi:hypothetical protein